MPPSSATCRPAAPQIRLGQRGTARGQPGHRRAACGPSSIPQACATAEKLEAPALQRKEPSAGHGCEECVPARLSSVVS